LLTRRYRFSPLIQSQPFFSERSSSSSKTKSSAPRRSSSQPSSSSRKKQGWNADYGSADDDFINDNSDSDSSASSSSAPFSHAALDAKRRIEEADDGNFLDVFKLNKKMDKREAFDVWFKDLVGQCHGFLEGKKVKRDKVRAIGWTSPAPPPPNHPLSLCRWRKPRSMQSSVL